MEALRDIIRLSGIIIMLLVYSLFLLHSRDTVKAEAPENRKLKSKPIWLQPIPFTGAIYSFTVAVKLSDTIAAEYRAKGQFLPVKRLIYKLALSWLFFCDHVCFRIFSCADND